MQKQHFMLWQQPLVSTWNVFVIVPSYDIFSEQLLYLLVPTMFGQSPLWILCSYWRKHDLMENKKAKHSG